MKTIDWTVARMLYEVFGETFEAIAECYEATPRMISYAAEQQNWERLPNVVDSPRVKGNEDEAVLDEIQDRLKMLQTVKSSALSPRYIALESAILTKAIEMVNSITQEDVAMAAKLKEAAAILRTLREQNGTSQNAQNGANNGNGSTRVVILNAVGHKSSVEQDGYEIVIDGRCGGGSTAAPRELPHSGSAPKDVDA